MELDVGQGCVKVSEKHEIVGMMGVNHLPLTRNDDGTFTVLLGRLDGLSIGKSIVHYQADDCITDHMRMINARVPFGEFGGRDRIAAMFNTPVADAKTVRDRMRSVDHSRCPFVLVDLKIADGYIYGKVKSRANPAMMVHISMLDSPFYSANLAAVAFAWKTFAKVARCEGLMYEDVTEVIGYNCEFLTPKELNDRRNLAGK